MKKIRIALFMVFCSFAVSVAGQTTTSIVITPLTSVFGTPDGNHVVGVSGDFAPGYHFGSFASDGMAKTDMYLPADDLFGREVTLGEIASITYWTKTGATHSTDFRDWYLNIYTKPYSGQLGGGWYGTRIGTEPYFSANIVDPANTWNQWSTEVGNNYLRFFESTYGYFGGYADPHYDSFITGTSLAGSRGPGVAYASQPILFFSPQTGSSWASGFTGQLDGLRIVLNDGSVANVNFEASDGTPANSDACKKGGWITSYRADFSTFKNQGDCIQYVKTGK
jgi:hypothetical protein